MYFQALNEANKVWTAKTDDFFPYASDPHAYWTGYFVSRPALKYMVRDTNNLLQVCKQMQVFSKQSSEDAKVTKLREVMGVLQHHDAVSGTAKQHVTFDYAQRLSEGISQCQPVIARAYDTFIPKNSQKPPQAQFCPLMNITECSVTENTEKFVVNVYNPLGRNVSKILRLPVPNPGYLIKNSLGQVLESQVMPIPEPVLLIPGKVKQLTNYFLSLCCHY